MVTSLIFTLLLCAQDSTQKSAKEERQELRSRISELSRMVRSKDARRRLDAIEALGTIDDRTARSLLAKQILDPSVKIRNAAAAALLPSKEKICIDALGKGAQVYLRDKKRLTWYLKKLGETDSCGALRVLMLTLKSKPSVGTVVLDAFESIGCTEPIPMLISFLKACETEERKPDFFKPLDTGRDPNNRFIPRQGGGKTVPNKTKNKDLAALAPAVRATLKKLTGQSYPEQRKWAAAMARGKLRRQLGAIYYCGEEKKPWTVAPGKSKKCPFFPGKSNHGDVLLKHVPQ